MDQLINLFQQLFEISREKRTSFEKDSLTTAYRLFNGEGDGIGGLIIDRYADYAVFHGIMKPFIRKSRTFDGVSHSLP